MGASDEVVTSILERGVASPGLQEIGQLVYVQFVLENLSREFRVVEDSNERVPELGFEFFDGIIILVEVQIRFPAGWILQICDGLDVLLILLASFKTESSSSSSRHGSFSSKQTSVCDRTAAD
jgi:hypothetical protein